MGGVGAPGVEEVEIAADAGAGLTDALVGSQIDLLVFDAPPKPLDEDIVAPASLAVHADAYTLGQQLAGEGLAGELAARSVLKISGLPWRARACSNTLTQKSASIEIDSTQASTQASTRRLDQSMIAAR
jgi:hypothetical protein